MLPDDVDLLAEARREVLRLLDRHESLDAPELGPLLDAARRRLATRRSPPEVVAGESAPQAPERRRVASAPVRPTSDRVREALFSILGDVEGATVLDLYCGTGAMGIEAISRGATGASWSTLTSRWRTATSTSSASRSLRGGPLRRPRLPAGAAARFDLIFCDPPYRLADRLEGELDSIIGSRLAPGGRLILEGSVRRPLRLDLPLDLERGPGDTLIRIHSGGAE